MSYYHENVTWQSQDGTWNQGFYTRISSMSFDDDYDSGWDDTYDDSFQFASSGHATPDDAWRSWGGPNPGQGYEVHYNNRTAKEIEHYEDLAARLYEQQGVSRISPIMGKGTAGYYGPHRTRSLQAIKAERDQLVESWAYYQLGGYANKIDQQRLEALDRQIEGQLPEATDQQRQDLENQDAQHLQRIQDQLDQRRRRISDRVRYRGRPPAHLAPAVDEIGTYLRQASKAVKSGRRSNRSHRRNVARSAATSRHSATHVANPLALVASAGTPPTAQSTHKPCTVKG